MDTLDQNKLITSTVRKTRIKFITMVCSITVLIISLFFLVIPGIFGMIYRSKFDDFVRMHGNLSQYTQPVSNVGFTHNSYKIGAIVNSYIGANLTGETSRINETEVILPFLKVNFYDNFGSSFSINGNNNLDITKKLLTMNPNSVAVGNFSFVEPKGINEIKSMLEEYEVQVHWFAVKTGLEDQVPKGITYDSISAGNPRQFGFPVSSSVGTSLQMKTIDYDNPMEYLDYIKGEWQWCIDNQSLVKNSGDLLVFQDMEAVLEGNVQIYGVTVFGVTDELSKMCEDTNFNFATISGFYPWDIIESSFDN